MGVIFALAFGQNRTKGMTEGLRFDRRLALWAHFSWEKPPLQGRKKQAFGLFSFTGLRLPLHSCLL